MKMVSGLLLFSLLFDVCANGQTTLSTSQLLAATLQNRQLAAQQRQLDFLQNTNHDLPWKEESYLRTSTDELDLARQDYMYRLKFYSHEERAAQRKLHQQDIHLLESEKMLTLQEQLLDRYLALVKFFDLQKEITLQAQLVATLTDRLSVLRKLAVATTDFDLPKIIATEEDLHFAQQKTMELNGRLAMLKFELSQGLTTDGSLVIDTSNWLTISRLKEISTQLSLLPSANPELQEHQVILEKSLAEYQVEAARASRVVDFVQLQYAGRPELSFGRELSFGMGFILPNKSARRLQLNELTLERIQDEDRLQDLELTLAERIGATRRYLGMLLEKHALATQQLAESQAAHSIGRYPALADADPLDLLEIQESLLKRQFNLLEIEKEIYLAYLDLLDLTGATVALPLRNYLSGGLEGY